MNRGSGFFINLRGKKLFYSWVGEPTAKTAWIFCNPFLEEKIFTIDVYKKFSDKLASNNKFVFRFDFEGDGDSEGDLSNVQISDWVNDIIAAKNFIESKFNFKDFSLFGLRLGGTLASLAGEMIPTNQIFVWDPILSGDTYFQECLRLNLFLQMSTYKKVIEDREILMQKLENDETINIMGFEIGKNLAKSLSAIKLENLDKIMILKFNKFRTQKAEDKNAIYVENFWHEPKNYNATQEELTDKSIEIILGYHN